MALLVKHMFILPQFILILQYSLNIMILLKDDIHKLQRHKL